MSSPDLPESAIRFGEFSADLETGELHRNGTKVKLQGQPFEILALLLKRPGRVVTREELRQRLWPSDTFVDFEHGLNAAVNRLREALGDSAEEPHFIETVPRRGYRFIAAIEGHLRAEPVEERIRTKTSAILVYGGAALGLTSLALAILFIYRGKQPYTAPLSIWVQITNFTDSATSPAISRDGRMLAFIRGPDTFAGPGQIYVQLLPGGEPLQLTRDTLHKMSPVFSPDGSRIAYTVGVKWDTWEVPTLGGEPHRMLPNASGLSWIGDHHVLFSEIKSGRHMGVVAATEGRAEERYVYLPQDEAGMAHRSSFSPDGRSLLVAEMDSVHGWLPCRVLPFDGTSSGKTIGPPGAHCTSIAWSGDGRWMYFSSDAGGSSHIWRQRFADGKLEQVTSGPTEEDGIAMMPDGHSFITSVGTSEETVWVHDSKGDRQITSEGYAEAPSLSPDGKTLFYLVRLRSRGHYSAGLYPNDDLWVVDLPTNRAEPLLPNFPVTGYSVAPDGQRVACSALDTASKSHLWLAFTDRHKTPELIPAPSSESEDLPIFASNGDLFFRGTSGAFSYLYRVKQGRNAPEKVIQDPIIEPQSVSPDGRWVITQVAFSGKEVARGIVAYPTGGGAPVRVCQNVCFVKWTFDGKFIYIHLLGTAQGGDLGKTFVIPLTRGNSLPPLSGIGSESELAALPGVKIIDGLISPGPDSTQYAFARLSVHMNLYRVPIP